MPTPNDYARLLWWSYAAEQLRDQQLHDLYHNQAMAIFTALQKNDRDRAVFAYGQLRQRYSFPVAVPAQTGDPLREFMRKYRGMRREA